MPGLVEEEKLPAGMRWVTAGPAPGPVPALLPAGMREVGAPPSAWAQGDIGQQFDQPAQPAPVSEQPQPPDQTKQPPALLALANRLRAMEVTGQVGALKGVGTIVANLGQLAYPMSVADKISGFSGSPEDLANRQAFTKAKAHPLISPQNTMESLGSRYMQTALMALPTLASGGAATPAQLSTLAKIVQGAEKGALWGAGTEAVMSGEVSNKTALAGATGALVGGGVVAVGAGYNKIVDTRMVDRANRLLRGADLDRAHEMGKDTSRALIRETLLPKSAGLTPKASTMVKPIGDRLNQIGTEMDAIIASNKQAVVDPTVVMGGRTLNGKLVQGPGSESYVGPLLEDVAGNLQEKAIQTGEQSYAVVADKIRRIPLAWATKHNLSSPVPEVMSAEEALTFRRALDARLTYGPPKALRTGELSSDSKMTQSIGKKMRQVLDENLRKSLGPDQAKFDELNKRYSDLAPAWGIIQRKAAEELGDPSLFTKAMELVTLQGRYGKGTMLYVRK